MGNSSGLAYDILDAVEYNGNNCWQLNQGSKKVSEVLCNTSTQYHYLILYLNILVNQGIEKENTKQNVSIFRFSKTGRPDRLPLAQRNVQKLRTIR